MSTRIIAFFNNKGGVGKTSLVYHLSWMYAGLGIRVVAVDLDPQANLTSAFLDEERLEELWLSDNLPSSVFRCLSPLFRGIGDISDPYLEEIDDNLSLLAGDLALSRFEDQLAEAWPKCLDRDERSFRMISAFWRIMQQAAIGNQADIILMDMGPSLGALNRAALVAADYVVVPLSPDLFSLQGLHNLGPALHRWRQEWQDRLIRNPAADLPLPLGRMQPIGYVVLQHSVRLDRPMRAYDHWMACIPQVYRTEVMKLNESCIEVVTIHDDPHCLALIKHYRSLVPLSHEARKPMFMLKAADGAIGAHFHAVQGVYRDFKALAEAIAGRTGIVSGGNHG